MYLSGDDIAALAHQLQDSPYSTLRLEADGFSLVLKREAAGWSAEVTSLATAPVAVATEQTAEEDVGPAIRAPLVGIFYRASKPGAPPFVEVGSRVAPDTVVGIIETMKLMNSVHAEISGRVSEILAADASFVESGQALMRIEEVGS